MRKPLILLLLLLGIADFVHCDQSLYSDQALYPSLELSWSTPSGVRKAESAFPHPLRNERAVLTTSEGALQTEDGGRSWKPWDTASTMGRIRTVAFDRINTEHFLVGANGLWETSDNGATFHQLATQKNGLASDSIADLIFYSGDPGNNTLLAVHGDDAPGLSRSRDGGKTWDVVNADYFFHRVVGGDSTEFKRLFLIGAPKDEPDVLGFYMSTTPGEYVSELMRDALPTDVAYSPAAGGEIVLATSDRGAFRMAVGRNSVGQDMVPLEVPDVPGWASLSVTWGPNADVLNLCAYSPAKAGFLISSDNFKTFQNMGGVPVSPLVKEGAAVRPNANGTIFYAIVNGSLSIGRAESAPRVVTTPAVLELSQDDPTSNDAREAFATFSKTADGRFGVAARQLMDSLGDLTAPYLKRRITVTAMNSKKTEGMVIDLSRIGGSPQTAMLDDGKHDDGAANDGTFGISFTFEGKRQQGDWRPGAPGPVPFGVAALSGPEKRTGAVALAGVYTKIASFDLWEKRSGTPTAGSDGEVAVRPVNNPPNLHGGTPCFRIEPRKGPWSVSIKVTQKARDITSYEAMSFWIRTEPGSNIPTSLNVQFSDHPEFSEPVTTPPVPIVPDLIERGILGAEYRRVVVPLDQLPASGFQPSRLDKIILSGDATSPSTLFIDGIRFHATRAEIDTP